MFRGSLPWLSFSRMAVLAVDDEFALLLLRQLPASGNRLVLRGENVALLAIELERPDLAARRHMHICHRRSLVACQPATRLAGVESETQAAQRRNAGPRATPLRVCAGVPRS